MTSQHAPRRPLWLPVVGAVLGAAVLAQLWRLATFKHYSLDEFQYSHAAWLVARGQVPYRDFFEFHFPLPYQVLSLPYLLPGAGPEGIRWLRWGMLPVVVLSLWALARLNEREGLWAQLSAPLFAVCAPSFILLGTEVRPDPFAFALFAASLALLGGRTPRPLAAGALFCLAVWSSQKAAVYGAILPLAWMADVAWRSRSAGVAGRLLVRPWRWLAGALAVAVGVAVYLLWTGSAAAWWDQTVLWAKAHERQYPGFPPTRYLWPAVRDQPLLFALALVGWFSSAVRWWRGPARWTDPQLLTLAAFGSTLFSFCLARAPFPYALVPFVGMAALFSARGLELVWRALHGRWARVWMVGALVAGVGLSGLVVIEREVGKDNAHQHRVLQDLSRLTTEADPVWDNSGGYSARPHVGFRFYTSGLIHRAEAQTLGARIAREIRDAQCTVAMPDARFEFLPADARAFVRAHFLPYSGDVWLWGKQFPAGAGTGEFEAVRTAAYFVEPASAVVSGELRIDGVPIREPLVSLERGVHQVDYRGLRQPLFLLWLPRDGERFEPKLEATPTFSTVF